MVNKKFFLLVFILFLIFLIGFLQIPKFRKKLLSIEQIYKRSFIENSQLVVEGTLAYLEIDKKVGYLEDGGYILVVSGIGENYKIGDRLKISGKIRISPIRYLVAEKIERWGELYKVTQPTPIQISEIKNQPLGKFIQVEFKEYDATKLQEVSFENDSVYYFLPLKEGGSLVGEKKLLEPIIFKTIGVTILFGKVKGYIEREGFLRALEIERM